MEAVVAAFLVANYDRLIPYATRQTVLDELERTLSQGEIQMPGGAAVVSVDNELGRRLVRNETLKICAPDEAGETNAVTLLFSEIIPSESTGNLIVVEVPDRADIERDGETVRVRYTITAVWLVDRVGLLAEGGDENGRGTQRIETRAVNSGRYNDRGTQGGRFRPYAPLRDRRQLHRRRVACGDHTDRGDADGLMTTRQRQTTRKTHGHGVAEQKRHRDLKECADELRQTLRRAAWFGRNADNDEKRRAAAFARIQAQ